MSPKILFRRIAGRIVPVKISTRINGAAVSATAKNADTFEHIAHISGSRHTKKIAKVNSFNIYPESARGQGIGTATFKALAKRLRRAGVEFLRGDLANPLAAKIRSKYNTRFLQATRTKGGVTTKLVDLNQALKTLKNPVHSRDSFSTIQATTKLRKMRKK